MLKTKQSFRQGKDKEMNNRREKTNYRRINQDIQQEQADGRETDKKFTRKSYEKNCPGLSTLFVISFNHTIIFDFQKYMCILL